MAEFQSTTDFKISSISITSADGKKSFDIKNLVQVFNYVESTNFAFLMGTMAVVDSGGLINSMPIQGGEIVKIKIQTNTNQSGEEYSLRVWKIGNRYVKNQDQSYTLGLISEEALNNECVRVEVPLNGKPDEIIAKLLKEYLKTGKQFNTEPCLFETKLIASRKRVFDIAAMLMPKSVPSSQKSVSTPTSSKKSSTATEGQEQTVGGSAGFFFWENKRGFNFYSVDTLCSDTPSAEYNVQTWGPYVEKILNRDDGADDRFTISEITFNSEVDLISGLRFGKYSTKMCFFNHSTGQYDEYVYNMKNAFDDMKHLGSQEEPSTVRLSANKTLADYPTKIMSMLLDHETWYNEDKPASPYEKDGATNPSQYSDRHLEYAAQSKARYETLSNQSVTIVIPGNSQICAGDKIDIRITNKQPSKFAKDDPFDPEYSGVYLIMEVTHSYDTLVGSNGRFTTTLRLSRDTHGAKDRISYHGTK
jgi:hypothetical protein